MEKHLIRIKEEFEIIESCNTGWPQLFQNIRQESSKYDFPCSEARSPLNKNLNRYRDVSPFDHSRVVLNSGPCNYINASHVKVQKAGRSYILTQGPLPQTAGHFWLMVWEQKSKAVLMLNKVIEKSQIKCHQYWPVGSKQGDSDTMVYQDVGLKVTLLSETKYTHFIIRTLSVEELATGNSREVLQFHYVTWPDFGVPSTPRAFLHFLQEVRDKGALDSNVGPPVVHCSAGIGRSGTYCLVDSCLLMMENDNPVNVKEVLLEMRKYRMGLIQTADQLRFSYQAILEGVQQMADGRSKFQPEDESILMRDWSNLDELKPAPPRRGSSLIPEDKINHVNKPLPPEPDSDSTEEEEDIPSLDGSDSSLDDSVDLEPKLPAVPCRAAEKVVVESHQDDKKAEGNGHAQPANGVEETGVRRRMKNEATMEKILEIKKRQKESEMKAEFYQRVYRSPAPKRRRSCSQDEDEDDDGDDEDEEVVLEDDGHHHVDDDPRPVQ